MALERQRGHLDQLDGWLQSPIVTMSSTSSTLPATILLGGHYRVLAGVDAVVMVLDSAKGIEAQTLKLFEVCRTRRLPVLMFLNKQRPPRP